MTTRGKQKAIEAAGAAGSASSQPGSQEVVKSIELDTNESIIRAICDKIGATLDQVGDSLQNAMLPRDTLRLVDLATVKFTLPSGQKVDLLEWIGELRRSKDPIPVIRAAWAQKEQKMEVANVHMSLLSWLFGSSRGGKELLQQHGVKNMWELPEFKAEAFNPNTSKQHLERKSKAIENLRDCASWKTHAQAWENITTMPGSPAQFTVMDRNRLECFTRGLRHFDDRNDVRTHPERALRPIEIVTAINNAMFLRFDEHFTRTGGRRGGNLPATFNASDVTRAFKEITEERSFGKGKIDRDVRDRVSSHRALRYHPRHQFLVPEADYERYMTEHPEQSIPSSTSSSSKSGEEVVPPGMPGQPETPRQRIIRESEQPGAPSRPRALSAIPGSPLADTPRTTIESERQHDALDHDRENDIRRHFATSQDDEAAVKEIESLKGNKEFEAFVKERAELDNAADSATLMALWHSRRDRASKTKCKCSPSVNAKVKRHIELNITPKDITAQVEFLSKVGKAVSDFREDNENTEASGERVDTRASGQPFCRGHFIKALSNIGVRIRGKKHRELADTFLSAYRERHRLEAWRNEPRVAPLFVKGYRVATAEDELAVSMYWSQTEDWSMTVEEQAALRKSFMTKEQIQAWEQDGTINLDEPFKHLGMPWPEEVVEHFRRINESQKEWQRTCNRDRPNETKCIYSLTNDGMPIVALPPTLSRRAKTTHTLPWPKTPGDLLRMEVYMYEWHLREQNGRPNLGWLRNAYFSLLQQYMRQHPGYWLRYVALREDRCYKLISYPYYMKSATPADQTKFRHIDINVERLHELDYGKFQIQGSLSLDDEDDDNCTELVKGMHRDGRLLKWWASLKEREDPTKRLTVGGGNIMGIQPWMWNEDDDKKFGKWTTVPCKKYQIRISDPRLPHGSVQMKGGEDATRITALPWYQGVVGGNLTMDIPLGGTWADISAIQVARDPSINRWKTPSGLANMHGTPPEKHAGAVILQHPNVICQALQGKARWDEIELQNEARYMICYQAYRQAAIKKIQTDLLMELWPKFCRVVAQEIDAYGENSFFRRLFLTGKIPAREEEDEEDTDKVRDTLAMAGDIPLFEEPLDDDNEFFRDEEDVTRFGTHRTRDPVGYAEGRDRHEESGDELPPIDTLNLARGSRISSSSLSSPPSSLHRPSP
jgi:hypothetical protein